MADPLLPPLLRVLIVDDSGTSRLALGSALHRLPNTTLVGSVATIAEGVQKLEELAPHVVLVDLYLQNEDGMELVDIIHERFPQTIPVLVTATNPDQIGPSLERLAQRRVEFLGKPDRKTRFDAWVEGPLSATFLRVRQALKYPEHERPRTTPRLSIRGMSYACPDLILVGSSTGGPAAVQTFLQHIPEQCTAPIVIAQHMPPVFTKVYAEQLNKRLTRSVVEASAGDILSPGGVWISPGDKHLTLSRMGRTWMTHLDDRPHLHGCRPAVDHLFSSVADNFLGLVAVVVLTGMGVDGRAGCARLREAGGLNVRVLAQSKESCAVWGMPAAVVESGLAHATASPEQLGELLRFERPASTRST